MLNLDRRRRQSSGRQHPTKRRSAKRKAVSLACLAALVVGALQTPLTGPPIYNNAVLKSHHDSSQVSLIFDILSSSDLICVRRKYRILTFWLTLGLAPCSISSPVDWGCNLCLARYCLCWHSHEVVGCQSILLLLLQLQPHFTQLWPTRK